MRPRFLLSALGSAGDVHPFIAVAQVLLARGHDVTLLTSPHFEDRIRRAGVPFAPLGEAGDYERLLERPELWQPRAGTRLVFDELLSRLPEAHAATDALASEPGTILVGSTLSWATRLVQERRGLPGATVHLSPVCIPSAIAPPILPGFEGLARLPTWSVRALQWAGERFVLDRWLGPRLDALRAGLDLPPVRRIWSRWIHSPDLVIGAWPAWFAPSQADWPPRTTTSGFPVFDEGGLVLDDALATFLDAGEPPIGITAGSAMAHGERFFERALAACGALGRRAVLISAFREQLPATLPDWARHVAYAPFGALVPRLSLLVHHGGVGTSAQALAAGVPQLVVPFAHDQFDNAARLRRLHVARSVDASASVDKWIDAMRVLTSDRATAEAVARYAARMAADEPGAHTIALALERLLPQGMRSR